MSTAQNTISSNDMRAIELRARRMRAEEARRLFLALKSAIAGLFQGAAVRAAKA